MCGIAGFIGIGTESTLIEMVTSISHRGPDYQGAYFNDSVGLAHARLSIIDLDSRSNQPFFSPDKKIAIVFNGEIYNYLSLKEDLLKTQKYYFNTTSDTEVLLYAYMEFGIKFLEKVHGMFAFGIYDFNKKELLLARDRMGKKPLYYTIQNNTLIFASELKAIVKHSLVNKELNFDAINEYLTFDYVPGPNTIFKNIHKLDAASYLIFREGKIQKMSAFWKVSFSSIDISYEDAICEFDHLFNKAVKDRLMSDVSLGVFLSGGLDSSSVAYYAQKNSSQKIKTFSIGFSEKSYDESSYARMVSAKLGTEHYEQFLSARQSLELLPEITDKLDEPFADPSIIPTYFLSKFTKQYVTVALGGDGSDELLAGYPTFISEQFASFFHALPNAVHQTLKVGSSFLPISDENISIDFKVKQFLKGFEEEKKYTHTLWLGSFTPIMKNKLFTKEIKNKIKNNNGLGIIDRYWEEANTNEYFNKLLYTYYRTYLLEDILVKVDRASMYSSLEVRAPFLDTKVVEFLSCLPKEFKIQGNNGKRILKDLMRNKIPNDIIDRPKKGFGIPVSMWLRNELHDLMQDMLSERRIKNQGIFNPDFVKSLVNNHLSKKQNNRKLLWNILILQLWFDRYF
jgi:asparagine synthase (glutamine-hydrolysing)